MRKLILYLIAFTSLTSIAYADNDTIDSKFEINDILIFNKSIIKDSDSLYNEIINNKRLRITYKENVITIKWASIDSIDSSKYEFAYILEGFDKEWYYTDKDTKATYTNLSPGRYQFKLKWAKNGIWTDTPDYLDITIIPPFWKTFWFKIISFFLIFGLLIIIIVILVVINTRLRKKQRGNN